MAKSIFISATGHGIGMTLITSALLQALGAAGRTTLAMKPVASGCWKTRAGLRNEDAELLVDAMNQDAAYSEVNPVAMEIALAPHVAARREGVRIDVPDLAKRAHKLATRADWLLVEGAGGLMTPLNDRDLDIDLAAEIGFPVLLVVGLRPGCLSDALLAAAAIQQRGLTMIGWIGTEPDGTFEALEETLEYLETHLPGECFGVIRWQKRIDARSVARQLHPALKRLDRVPG